MTEFRAQLAERFRKQQGFATDYSPLYALLFGLVADWLENDRPDALVDWLLDVSAGRKTIDVSLLLLAGVHRQVLSGADGARMLATFFPTAGGQVPLTATAELRDSFRTAIWEDHSQLEPFIREANVQTNETGRGLAWLLPFAHVRWPAVHLIELGASAGLNLVAERRAYRLEDDSRPPHPLLELGTGLPPQFTTTCRGSIGGLADDLCCPKILSRTGIDIAPFHLQSPADERALASFVWGDQLARLDRLREGIAAFRAVGQTAAPVNLVPGRLPDDLPELLAGLTPVVGDAPILIYNTTMAMYLPDGNRSIGEAIRTWADDRREPVLWVQWEPPIRLSDAPIYGDHAWTVDLWHGGRHDHWLLAWVHPHGTMLEWLPGAQDFYAISMQT